MKMMYKMYSLLGDYWRGGGDYFLKVFQAFKAFKASKFLKDWYSRVVIIQGERLFDTYGMSPFRVAF